MKKKAISESFTVLSSVMMPAYANHYGSVHGGTILKFVDEAAYTAATRHARENVVIASMDHIEFRHPVRIGDLLTLSASIYYCGRTSMEIEVEIITEKIKEGKKLKVGSAYLTMVALDDKGKPTEVPGLILKTPEEINKNKEIGLRRKKRLEYFRDCPPKADACNDK